MTAEACGRPDGLGSGQGFDSPRLHFLSAPEPLLWPSLVFKLLLVSALQNVQGRNEFCIALPLQSCRSLVSTASSGVIAGCAVIAIYLEFRR